ncbi:MAG: hypothetical protein M0C28_48380, partial [Candidatus Moduliflexus flocculans]|nr:hypothetical protein [Candidatus Moduliflexus flocculans]
SSGTWRRPSRTARSGSSPSSPRPPGSTATSSARRSGSSSSRRRRSGPRPTATSSLEDVLVLTREIEELKGRLAGFEEDARAPSEPRPPRAEPASARRARSRPASARQEIERLRGQLLPGPAGPDRDQERERQDRQGARAPPPPGREARRPSSASRTASSSRSPGGRPPSSGDIADARGLRQGLIGRAEDIKTALGAARSAAEEAQRRLEALQGAPRRVRLSPPGPAAGSTRRPARRARTDDVPGRPRHPGRPHPDEPRERPSCSTPSGATGPARGSSRPRSSWAACPRACAAATCSSRRRPGRPSRPRSWPGPASSGSSRASSSPTSSSSDRLAGLEDAVIVADDRRRRPGLDRAPRAELPDAVGRPAPRLRPAPARAEGRGRRRPGLGDPPARSRGRPARKQTRRPLVAEFDERIKDDRSARGRARRRSATSSTGPSASSRTASASSRYGLGDGDKVRMTQTVLGRELENLRGEKEPPRRGPPRRGGQPGRPRRPRPVSLKDRHRGAGAGPGRARRPRGRGLERRFFEASAGLDLVQEKINGLGEQLRAAEKRKEAAAAKIELLEADARKSEEDQVRLREEIAGPPGERQGPRRGAGRGRDRPRGHGDRPGSAPARPSRSSRPPSAASRQEEEAAKDERVRHEIHKAEVDRDLVNLDEMCWQELKKTLTELRAEAKAAEEARRPAPRSRGRPRRRGRSRGDARGGSRGERRGRGRRGPRSRAETAAAEAAPKPRRVAKKWRPLAEMTDEDVEKELEESREAIARFKAVNLMAEEEYVEQKTALRVPDPAAARTCASPSTRPRRPSARSTRRARRSS